MLKVTCGPSSIDSSFSKPLQAVDPFPIRGRPLPDLCFALLPALTSQRFDKLKIEHAVDVVAVRRISLALSAKGWPFPERVSYPLLTQPTQLYGDGVIALLVDPTCLQGRSSPRSDCCNWDHACHF
jgi:hypothetical protein